LWAVGGYVGQVLIHASLYRTVRMYQQYCADRLPVLVVGTRHLAAHLVNHLNTNAWLPDRVVGVVDDVDSVDPEWNNPDSPCLGGVDKLPYLIRKHEILRVYIALPMQSSSRIGSINDGLSGLGVDVVWVPDIFCMNLLNHSVREVGGLALVSLSESPMMSGGGVFAKSLLDRVLALISLVLFSPLLLGTALAIKFESSGPVIFKQKRHGWGGKVIWVWKFRSMYVDQPVPDQVQQATRDDPRVTRVGRFIRRTSIDELPQLFNVLQGSMSMVGPRPHAVLHNEEYSKKIDAYLMRHRIKPGITGLAQVNGYRGETDTLEKMQKRVEYDLAYINSWSIWLDFMILAKTPFSLFSNNIY
ncbi:MAG: undecaprenyl-phosphate glucose phosphotransferase, partial [Motiliproteus sp.]